MRWIVLSLFMSILVAGCVSLRKSEPPKAYPVRPVSWEIIPESSQVSFEWNVDSPFKDWLYRLNISPLNTDITYYTTTTSLSGTVTGLLPGGYTWWVDVISPDGKVKKGDVAGFYLGGPGRLRLNSPQEGIVLNPGSVTFSWSVEKEIGVENYELILCSKNCQSFKANESFISLRLDYNTTYRWKVVVHMTNGGTLESETRSFKTAPPSPPLPIRPTNGATDLNPDHVVLEWTGDVGPYTVRVFDEGGIVFETVTSGTEIVLTGLDYAEIYSWYVESDAGSSTVSFFKTHVPNPPTIVNPPIGSEGVRKSDYLIWSYSDKMFRPKRFVIGLDKDTTLDSSVSISGTSVVLSDIANVVGLDLEPGMTVYWSVKAMDHKGRITDETFGSFKLKVPSIPVLLTPQNGEQDIDPDNVQLMWEGEDEEYELVLMKNGTVVRVESVNSTSVVLNGLDYSSVYEWYVVGDSGTSTKYWFKTHVPAAPSMDYPSEPGQTGVDVNDVIIWSYDDPYFVPDHYVVYLSEVPSFSSSELIYGSSIKLIDLINSIGLSISGDETLYLAVEAVDTLGRKSPRIYSVFSLSPSISSGLAPIIVSPENGSTDLDPDHVVLNWEGFSSTYTVYLNDGSNVTTFEIEGTELVLSSLNYSTRYDWYVEDKNGSSLTYTFYTYLPMAPDIIHPQVGDSDIASTDFLRWSYPTEELIFDLDHYVIYMSDDVDTVLDASLVVYNESIAIDDAANLLGISLNSGNTIYWAVQGVDDLGRTTPLAFGAFRLK